MKQLDFSTAFKYPFNRAVAMWNILWIFVPIVGWLILIGYGVRIMKEFSEGKFKELPKLEVGNDLELGFMMLLKAIPFMIVYGVIAAILDEADSFSAGLASAFIALFIVPILSMNFINKQTIVSYFEFKTLKPVFENLGDYVMVLLKSILLGVVFLLMCLVLIGIPAAAFTKNIFLADFYHRQVK